MRLNFSGADSDDIREGVKRIGKVVREQIALYGTFTGRPPAGEQEKPARKDKRTGEGTDRLAEVVRLPERARERRAQ
jgi:2-aminoadipate transaminase